MAELFERYPAPGQYIEVNRHRLHLYDEGEGIPAVVFESGQAGFSLDWMRVQPEVAKFSQAYSYDRAGLGWSDAGPHPRTPSRIVAELHSLLDVTEIPKPYILVAHSLGGRYVRLYAHHYPDDVAGMVLVDPYNEAFDRALGDRKLAAFKRGRTQQYRFFDLLARLGIARRFGNLVISLMGPDFRSMPDGEKARYAALVTRPDAMTTTIQEFDEALAAEKDFRSLTLPATMPLRVLRHGIPWPYADQEKIWQESQAELVAQSAHGELAVADRSGHSIMMAQPELVIETIQKIVTLVRSTSS
ncbi:MAG TPA: alpha/beta hydrolase [Aggregatilineales bacterium]|nr:alpha/beta hydrolase [Aggregatilineales bacterium]